MHDQQHQRTSQKKKIIQLKINYPALMSFVDDNVLDKFFGVPCNTAYCETQHNYLKVAIFNYLEDKHDLTIISAKKVQELLEGIIQTSMNKQSSSDLKAFVDGFVIPNQQYINEEHYQFLYGLVYPKLPAQDISDGKSSNSSNLNVPESLRKGYSPGVIAGIITALSAIAFLAYEGMKNMLVSEQSVAALNSPDANFDYVSGLTSTNLQAKS